MTRRTAPGRARGWAAAAAALLAACASPRAAEDTRAVFAAVLCAYDAARASAGADEAARLDAELGRIRGMFRAEGKAPRPCSDATVRALSGCIRVAFERGELASGWRATPACASSRVSRYW